MINIESLFSRRNNHHLLTQLKSLTEIRKNLSGFFLGSSLIRNFVSDSLTLLLARKVINIESLFSRRNNHHLLTQLKSLTEIRKNLSGFFLGSSLIRNFVSDSLTLLLARNLIIIESNFSRCDFIENEF